MSPSAPEHNNAAGAIYASLRAHRRVRSSGHAYVEAVGFLGSSGRVHCPDVAWHPSPLPRKRKVIDGFPPFAAEVRSDEDYGPAAERRMAAKRAAYFAEGTLVVWDVDVMRAGLIRAYRADEPEHATVYRAGEMADAEPAVPGWRFPVDEMFD